MLIVVHMRTLQSSGNTFNIDLQRGQSYDRKVLEYELSETFSVYSIEIRTGMKKLRTYYRLLLQKHLHRHCSILRTLRLRYIHRDDINGNRHFQL